MGGYRRFCVECGSELKQGARFCANCGHAAANDPQPAATGEHGVTTRDLPVPPPSPAWDASAAPPGGALFPPPGSAFPPQDVPYPAARAPGRPRDASYPPTGTAGLHQDIYPPARPPGRPQDVLSSNHSRPQDSIPRPGPPGGRRTFPIPRPGPRAVSVSRARTRLRDSAIPDSHRPGRRPRRKGWRSRRPARHRRWRQDSRPALRPLALFPERRPVPPRRPPTRPSSHRPGPTTWASARSGRPPPRPMRPGRPRGHRNGPAGCWPSACLPWWQRLSWCPLC